ncbi:hypothetical protein BDR03DRAFT_900496 [Suillus americanus]|nr:hypothetical protein BDR03DRAFT_900496 [Suillus americanus]
MSTLGKFWSFLLSVRKEHRIITSGPYSIIRHPSYTSFIVQYVGIVITHASEGSWMRHSGSALHDSISSACLLHVYNRRFN